MRSRGARFIVSVVIALLCGWWAWHAAEQRELAEVMRTSPHDGQAGMDIFAAGLYAWIKTVPLAGGGCFLLLTLIAPRKG